MIMWLCFNDGFVSAVETNEPGKLKVRARRREILETLFPAHDIHETERTDYKYRVFCTKAELAEIVHKRIMNIDYSNFKNSVKDDALHDLYEDFWFDHWHYQR